MSNLFYPIIIQTWYKNIISLHPTFILWWVPFNKLRWRRRGQLIYTAQPASLDIILYCKGSNPYADWSSHLQFQTYLLFYFFNLKNKFVLGVRGRGWPFPQSRYISWILMMLKMFSNKSQTYFVLIHFILFLHIVFNVVRS